MGKDLKDVAKSYVLSQLGQEAFKGLTDTGIDTNIFGETGATFAKDIKDVFGKTGSDIIGKTAGQYVAGEGKIDIGNLLLNQGVGAATNAVLGEIPGFDGLNATEKKFVTNIVSSTLNDGKLSPNEAISAAFTAATQAMKNTSKGTKVADAGTDNEFQLPGGTQVAGPYSIDVAGVPLFQESVPEGFTPPAGLRLLSVADDVKEVYDSEGKFLKETKPMGSYIDYSILPGKGVWVVKDDFTQKFDTSKFADDIAMFYQNQGDLDKIAQGTPSTFDDELADLLKYKGIKNTTDLNASKLTNDDLFAMFNSSFGNSFNDKKVNDGNIDSLDITGKRIPGTVGDLDTTKTDDKTTNKTDDTIGDDKKEDDIDELVITDKKDDKVDLSPLVCGEGMELSEDGKSCVPIKKVTPPIKCGEGFKLSADGKSCVPIGKTTGPIKCNEGFELSADGKSCVPIKKKTTPTQPSTDGVQSAPSQDPYAHIKFMEELFGGNVSPQFLTDVLGGKKDTDDNLAALLSLLRK